MTNADPTQDQQEKLALVATERGAVLAFLSDQFMQSPTRDERSIETLAEAWKGLSATLPCAAGESICQFLAGAQEQSSDLATEFQALFKVPTARNVAPIESVYRNAHVQDGNWIAGKLRGTAWQQTLNTYRQAGFEIEMSKGVEADHIGLQLHFLSALCDEEAVAWRAGDAQLAADRRAAQATFIGEHLLSWIGKLRDRVVGVADLPYYVDALTFAEEFLTLDLGHLR